MISVVDIYKTDAKIERLLTEIAKACLRELSFEESVLEEVDIEFDEMLVDHCVEGRIRIGINYRYRFDPDFNRLVNLWEAIEQPEYFEDGE